MNMSNVGSNAASTDAPIPLGILVKGDRPIQPAALLILGVLHRSIVESLAGNFVS